MDDFRRLYGRCLERYAYGWYRGSAWNGLSPAFPRTIAQRIDRMDRLMEWKIEQIRARWMRRIAVAALLAFGLPLAIGIMSWLWRFANVSVLG